MGDLWESSGCRFLASGLGPGIRGACGGARTHVVLRAPLFSPPSGGFYDGAGSSDASGLFGNGSARLMRCHWFGDDGILNSCSADKYISSFAARKHLRFPAKVSTA